MHTVGVYFQVVGLLDLSSCSLFGVLGHAYGCTVVGQYLLVPVGVYILVAGMCINPASNPSARRKRYKTTQNGLNLLLR